MKRLLSLLHKAQRSSKVHLLNKVENPRAALRQKMINQKSLQYVPFFRLTVDGESETLLSMIATKID